MPATNTCYLPPVLNSAQRVSRRRHPRMRNLVNRLMCRDGKLEESLKQRAVRAFAAHGSRRTVLGRFLKYVKKHPFHLFGNAKVNDARIAYPNHCFLLGFQHHRGSQLLPPWLVGGHSGRCGSGQLPRNYPHVAVLILHLRVMDVRPSRLVERIRKDLVPSFVPLLPC